MTAAIDRLEQMAALSESMLEAATANDWDRLVELERQFKAVREQVEAQAPEIAANDESDASLLRKARMIERMLANQQGILQHVNPWMESTRKLLADHSRDRAVRAAYGATRF